MPEACERGLSSQGAGNAAHELAQVVVIEDVNEFGDQDAIFSRLGTHGQLVSKVANGGQADAG